MMNVENRQTYETKEKAMFKSQIKRTKSMLIKTSKL